MKPDLRFAAARPIYATWPCHHPELAACLCSAVVISEAGNRMITSAMQRMLPPLRLCEMWPNRCVLCMKLSD
jgi:hypothetical protein